MHAAALWGALWLAGLAACSPALDWRDSPVASAQLQVLMPCRPDHHERVLSLAGQSVTLAMQVCEAGGLTFAVSTAQMDGPARVGPALEALRAAFERNLQRPPGPKAEGLTLHVPGQTPQPMAGRWRLQGRTPEGDALHAELAVFARGRWVVQATVLARQALPDTATQTFVEGLRFSP